MRRSRAAFLAIAVVVVVAGRARAQEQAPVAADLIKGRTLTLASDNCSIDAPGDGYSWTTGRSVKPPLTVDAFTCRKDPAAGAVATTLYLWVMRPAPRLDDAYVDSVVNGLKKTFADAGFTVGAVERTASDAPFPGHSYRYSLTFSSADKKTGKTTVQHVYGALAVTVEAQYMLQCKTTEASEPAAFTDFVGSLKLLHPVAKASGPRVTGEELQSRIAGYVGPFIVIVLVLALAKKLSSIFGKKAG
jgi:hypothetical protein